MRRVSEIGEAASMPGKPAATITLTHDARHLRRKVLNADDGTDILIDLPEARHLPGGTRLKLDDDTLADIHAAPEHLLEILPRDATHHARLCWHIGNRHLAAQIEAERILVLRDHVIAEMLRGLGATVREVEAPFEPMAGAYHAH